MCARGLPSLPDRASALLHRQVTRFAYLHSSDRAVEFLRAWQAAPPNPGGE